jgi:hypothetical protein
MFHAMFAGLALSLAAPALAAQPPAAAPARPSAPAPADPARLAAAERLVALVMPEDAMRRMLSQGIPGMADAAMEMSPEELGMPDTPGMSEADRRRSLADLGGTRDPHFRERMQIGMRVSGEVMAEMMTEVMPVMIRAYANHFARRLTLAELNELVAVFSTPTARKYTEAWLGMAQDADFAELMREMMPQMMRTAARMEERLRAATAHLPPPPPPEGAPEAGATEAEQ